MTRHVKTNWMQFVVHMYYFLFVFFSMVKKTYDSSNPKNLAPTLFIVEANYMVTKITYNIEKYG